MRGSPSAATRASVSSVEALSETRISQSVVVVRRLWRHWITSAARLRVGTIMDSFGMAAILPHAEQERAGPVRDARPHQPLVEGEGRLLRHEVGTLGQEGLGRRLRVVVGPL